MRRQRGTQTWDVVVVDLHEELKCPHLCPLSPCYAQGTAFKVALCNSMTHLGETETYRYNFSGVSAVTVWKELLRPVQGFLLLI